MSRSPENMKYEGGSDGGTSHVCKILSLAAPFNLHRMGVESLVAPVDLYVSLGKKWNVFCDWKITAAVIHYVAHPICLFLFVLRFLQSLQVSARDEIQLYRACEPLLYLRSRILLPLSLGPHSQPYSLRIKQTVLLSPTHLKFAYRTCMDWYTKGIDKAASSCQVVCLTDIIDPYFPLRTVVKPAAVWILMRVYTCSYGIGTWKRPDAGAEK